MVKITHPDMRKGTDLRGSVQTSETFVVDDSSEQTDLDRRIAEFEGIQKNEQHESVEEAKPVVSLAKHRPKFSMNENIQKSLENLIFIGRHNKVLDLAGHKFEISTLTHREHNHVIEELSNLGDSLDFFAIRIFTLAYALRKIDGKTLDQVDIGEDIEDSYSRKLTIIDYLQLSLVEKLWTAYEGLVKEVDAAVYGENIKN